MSIHPDHYFPNAAPKGHHMIDRTCRLMEGDLCWHMDTDTWHPIDPARIGCKDTSYMRLARPNRNSLVARARRSKVKWQPISTGSRHCIPLLLKVGRRITMGRTLSIGPSYARTGWFEEMELGWPTDKRIYPTAWAPLPER